MRDWYDSYVRLRRAETQAACGCMWSKENVFNFLRKGDHITSYIESFLRLHSADVQSYAP
jgi:hypothetical protein